MAEVEDRWEKRAHELIPELAIAYPSIWDRALQLGREMAAEARREERGYFTDERRLNERDAADARAEEIAKLCETAPICGPAYHRALIDAAAIARSTITPKTREQRLEDALRKVRSVDCNWTEALKIIDQALEGEYEFHT